MKEQADQLEEAARKFSALEGSLQDQTVRERIQEVEKTQNIAELKQTIANLEFQNQQVSPQQCRLAVSQTASVSALQLVRNSESSSELLSLEDRMSKLKKQTNNFQVHNDTLDVGAGDNNFENLQLPTPDCTPIVEYKLFFPYK